MLMTSHGHLLRNIEVTILKKTIPAKLEERNLQTKNQKQKNITSSKREMKHGKNAKFWEVYSIQKKTSTEERY